jgi:uncharacterized membrane protein
MSAMHTVAGILVLLVGVAFPMGMLVWLNGRMRRQPALQPRQVGMLLALNGILPVGLVLVGFWLIYPPFGASPAARVAIVASGLAVLALLVALWWSSRSSRQTGGPNAR